MTHDAKRRFTYDASFMTQCRQKHGRGTVTPKCTPKRTRRDKDIDLKSNFLTTATLNPLHALKAESSRGHISSSRNIKLGFVLASEMVFPKRFPQGIRGMVYTRTCMEILSIL